MCNSGQIKFARALIIKPILVNGDSGLSLFLAGKLLAERSEARVGCIDALSGFEQFFSLSGLAKLELDVGQKQIGLDVFGIIANGLLKNRRGIGPFALTGD